MCVQLNSPCWSEFSVLRPRCRVGSWGLTGAALWGQSDLRCLRTSFVPAVPKRAIRPPGMRGGIWRHV